MYQNVINFKKNTIPNDLIKINDLAEKYNISYHFLYKWSVLAKKQGIEGITPYYFGALKLSESETLNFLQKRSLKKWQG